MLAGGFAELWKMTVDAVIAAEVVYPEAGKGKEKLQAVTAQVQAYAPLIGLGAEIVDRLGPLISSFVNSVVSRFNKSGFPTPVTVEPVNTSKPKVEP